MITFIFILYFVLYYHQHPVMPTSLFFDMDQSGRGLQETRALELALELTRLGYNNNDNDSISNTFDSEPRSKKSQNTTECVPVPSSEHVAEIVGRQGCKIKSLRAKTNTYIKTPVRGEEPVFVVTGRKEDVVAAKKEILSAAEHFSQIRAQRKNNLNGSLAPGPNSNIPGQTTLQVRVPYRVVGLVVGPKGATIKRIQQQTNTYIVTPSRDKEPVFEVTGLPDNVEHAKREIESHIAMRTGNILDSGDGEFSTNGIDVASLTNNLNMVNSTLFKADATNSLIFPFTRDSNNPLEICGDENLFNFSMSNSSINSKPTDLFNSAFSNPFPNPLGFYDNDEGLGESPTFDLPGGPYTSSWPDFGSTSLSDALSAFTTSSTSNTSSSIMPRNNSISEALSELAIGDHPPARRSRSEPLAVPIGTPSIGVNSTSLANVSSFSPLAEVTSSTSTLLNGFSVAPTTSGSTSVASSPTESLTPGRKSKKECTICFESEVVAALVPCGHNMFCLECANRICEKSTVCPICRQPATQAIRIYC